jgi:hypothetical protein
MKKFVAFWLICVIFVLICCAPTTLPVSASSNEKIDFIYNNKIFSYQLENNIKTSNVFDAKHKLNKYNRFGSTTERQNLLKYMLSIGIDKEIALEYIFPNITKKINKIEKNIYIKPENAKMKINTNSEKVFHISSEIVGKTVDKNKLINDLCTNYLSGKNLQINIPTTTLTPKLQNKIYKNLQI